MSFIAQAPNPSTVTEPPVEPIVENDGWFPDINPAHLRSATRLNGTVTPERLALSLAAAIIAVNSELQAWKAEQLANGYITLEDVSAPKVGDKSIKLYLYQRAVYGTVQADLVDRYRDFDTTGAGDKHADDLMPTADTLRRDVRWAISDLIGIRRTTVELI